MDRKVFLNLIFFVCDLISIRGCFLGVNKVSSISGLPSLYSENVLFSLSFQTSLIAGLNMY